MPIVIKNQGEIWKNVWVTDTRDNTWWNKGIREGEEKDFKHSNLGS